MNLTLDNQTLNVTRPMDKSNKKNFLPWFKDDFQSVLRTLTSLFMFFCFVSCKTSQNVNILQLLTQGKFQSLKTTAIMDTKRAKLNALFFLISLHETTSQLHKSMKLLEKEFGRSQRYGMWFLTNNKDSHE